MHSLIDVPPSRERAVDADGFAADKGNQSTRSHEGFAERSVFAGSQRQRRNYVHSGRKRPVRNDRLKVKPCARV